MSMNTGVSGLQAASQDLNIISNNIANANTTGYKTMDVQFADVYSATSGSGGVYVSDIDTNFAQGTLVYTSSKTDLAIDGGGFFIMQDVNGQDYYTRAGSFDTDKNGFMVNDQGQFLMGYAVDENGNVIEGQLEPLPVNTSDLPAHQTDSAQLTANLDSRKDTVDAGRFDPSKPDTYHSTTTTTVYDSQGNEQQLTAYYMKTDTNTWEVRYEANGETILADKGGEPIVDKDGNPVLGKDGNPTFSEPKPYSVTMEFNANGALKASSDSISGDHTYSGQFNIPLDFNNGTASMQLALDVSSMSQYGNDFAVSKNAQDGYPAGKFYGVSISDAGAIVATYSNGESEVQGFVALATFPAVSQIESAGNTSWQETPESGEAIVGLPNTGTNGGITGGALESSNVDMSAELVDMIVAQSAYQANTKTISTFDENTQYLLNTF